LQSSDSTQTRVARCVVQFNPAAFAMVLPK
jgi:hypothetical protein